MRIFTVLLLIGIILTAVFFAGIGSSASATEEDSQLTTTGNGGEEVSQDKGYQLTPEDKSKQLVSIIILFAIMLLAI